MAGILSGDYTAEQFAALFVNTDEATVSNLYEFYKYRTPCDNFPHFIRQTEILFASQYKKLLRDESVTYDAMVSEYMERLVVDDRSGKNSRSGTGTTTEKTTGGMTEKGTSENIRTDNLQQNTEGTNNSTTTNDLQQSTTGDTSGTTTDNSTTTDTSKTAGMSKTNPQSVSYSSASAGAIPSLSWTSADGQTQQEESETTTVNDSRTNSETHHNVVKNTGTATTSADDNHTVTNTGTVSDDGKTTRETSQNGSKDGSTTTTEEETKSETGTTKERYTGRHGYTPAEMLEKSRDYILGTNAFKWLCEKYNSCFVWEVEL